MSKFCQNCGGVMEDDQVVCANCGAQNEAAPAGAGFDKSKLPALIGICVAAVAVIVVLIILITSIFGGGGYKSALDTYLDVTYKGKFSKIEDMAPKAYWEWYEDENDETVEDLVDEAEDEWEDILDSYEDEYGKNIKYKYTIDKEKELSKNKVSKIADALDEAYDIDPDTVKKVIDVEGEIEISGKDDSEDWDFELSFAKIGGDWYIISYGEYDGEYYAYFYMG